MIRPLNVYLSAASTPGQIERALQMEARLVESGLASSWYRAAEPSSRSFCALGSEFATDASALAWIIARNQTWARST